MCVCVNQIKTANNAVGDLFFFNSLNKMTNAAYENAMRRCLRN